MNGPSTNRSTFACPVTATSPTTTTIASTTRFNKALLLVEAAEVTTGAADDGRSMTTGGGTGASLRADPLLFDGLCGANADTTAIDAAKSMMATTAMVRVLR